MSPSSLVCRTAAVLVFLAFGASQAGAQATRTWVSGVGDDANPCSRTAPCKTFAGAISKTAAGGEISVLDNGAYGAVTITKSITINANSSLAGVLATLGSSGIVVNAGVSDIVVLRNLSFSGAGSGANGIRFLAGRVLRVENCTIANFTNRGIDVVHGSTTTPGELTVIDTSITNIGSVAIRIDNGSTAVSPSASLSGVSINRTGIGLDVLKNGVATLTDSVISHVVSQAVVAENSAAINVVGSTISKSGTGVSAFNSTSTVRVGNSSIVDNTTGVSIAGGATGESSGDNQIFGNGTDIVGTFVVVGTE